MIHQWCRVIRKLKAVKGEAGRGIVGIMVLEGDNGARELAGWEEESRVLTTDQTRTQGKHSQISFEQPLIHPKDREFSNEGAGGKGV